MHSVTNPLSTNLPESKRANPKPIDNKILLSAKKFFDRYAVLLERAKSKGLISFCEVSP